MTIDDLRVLLTRSRCYGHGSPKLTREQIIYRAAFTVHSRFYAEPMLKLREIGEYLGVTTERIRQIEAKALRCLTRLEMKYPGSVTGAMPEHDLLRDIILERIEVYKAWGGDICGA